MTQAALDADAVNAFSGQGRRFRKSRREVARMRSHYRHANWQRNEAGLRAPMELDFNKWSRQRASIYLLGVHSRQIPHEEWLYALRYAEAHSNPEHTDLIHTTYRNKSSGTLTCHTIAFDLDYGKAADAYKRDGRLHWPAMFEVLLRREPVLARRIGEVAYSSSGQGLGLALPVSPIELETEGSRVVEDMAYKLQARLIRIFNYYGFGADTSAKGLSRWMPNFRNPKKFVDGNTVARSMANNRRDQVIRELLNATDDHPALDYVPKKSHKDDFIYHYAPVEKGLSKLYMHLLDDVGLHDSLQISIKMLTHLTGVSDKTLRKVLKEGLCWLDARHVNLREGWRLTLRPTPELTKRARSLASGGKGAGANEPMRRILCHPSDVGDGDRYAWRGNVLLAMKLRGLDEQAAVRVLGLLRDLVPDGVRSRSLTSNLKAGVKSFWTKRLFDKQGFPVLGSRPHMPVPDWLEEAIGCDLANQTRKQIHRKDPFGSSVLCPPDPPAAFLEADSPGFGADASPLRPGASPRDGGAQRGKGRLAPSPHPLDAQV